MIQPGAAHRTIHERERLHREAGRRWQRLGEAYPELAETIAYGRGLVALYIDDLPAPASLDLTVERAREKLAAGVPLLVDEDFDVDSAGLRHFFYRLCTWASRQPALAEGGARLERALLDAQIRVEELFHAALVGDDLALDVVAQRLEVPPALMRTLAGYTLVATLMSTARPLGSVLTAINHRWEQVQCPVCGGPPLLAELLGNHADRWLRCSLCGSGWHVPADRCIHCGTTDPTAREILSIGEQRLPNRLETCRHCRGYLKLATVPAPTPPELLTIVETAFMALEEAARDQGFTPAPAR
jgi:FdhE protein